MSISAGKGQLRDPKFRVNSLHMNILQSQQRQSQGGESSKPPDLLYSLSAAAEQSMPFHWFLRPNWDTILHMATIYRLAWDIIWRHLITAQKITCEQRTEDVTLLNIQALYRCREALCSTMPHLCVDIMCESMYGGL